MPSGGGRGWLYVRVSSRGQATDGTSLDGQQEAGARFFAARRAPAPEVRLEVESAGDEKIERRVVLHGLIRDARPGDLVAVASLDRWSRDIVWGLKSIRELVARGIGFIAIREALDAASPEGKERLGLLLWVAENERTRIRQRTVGRADELRAQGLWALGRVPYGYRRGDRGQRRQLLLDAVPEAAVVVVEWHERLAGGESLRDVAKWLGQHEGAPHDASAVHRMVRQRIYLGEIRIGAVNRKGGEWIKGQHPALITEDLWRRVQAALANRRASPGPAAHPGVTAEGLLLPGLLRCALCGRRCGAIRVTEKPWLRYYVCAKRRHRKDAPEGCAGAYARVEAVDDQVEPAILGRLAELREHLAARAPAVHRDVKPENFDRVRQRLEQRRARAVSAHVDGLLSAAELAAQRARLDGELAALRAREESAVRETRAANPAARGSLRRALADLRRAWRGATPEERREHVRDLASRVELLADRSLRWTWRTIEDLLAE